MRLNHSVHIPGYTIVELLGETHYSSVYRARPEQVPDTVILKVLGAIDPSAEQLARFKRENTLIQHLDMDGIVHPIDFIENDDLAVIVLEDFDGVTLSREIFSNPLGLERFLKLAIKLAEIIGALHQANITHCDIKPSNILLNPESDTLKLTDFGISEIVPFSDSSISVDVLKGTLAYISPEQTGRMNCGVDYRTDLYSLGVTFYEMLTGVVPFRFVDPMDFIHAHIAKQPLPPEKQAPQVPGAVSDIVMKLMAKSVEDRYQNGFGLAADLVECLHRLRTQGRITPFALGAKDVSPRFILPRQLVGRKAERQALQAAFDRVSRGCAEVVAVSGAAGSGKSALVHEMYKPITAKGGYFLAGKFEQLHKAVPYSAIVQAFQSLVRQLLAENNEKLKVWKRKIQAALGPNGKIITDVIPEVEQIIGKQLPVPELGPEETQNRFKLFFKNFVRVLADQNYPLVLFLDDLQWADSASIRLIQTVLSDQSLRFLLFVGAYRDTEVSEFHPLVEMRNGISAVGVTIHAIHLKALEPQDINHLITPFLRCEPAVSQPLANVIHEKTKGSPFFIHQFLKRLYDKAQLFFDPEKNSWNWNLHEINNMPATENVVAFMVEKLHDMPADTLQIVQLCAVIGDRLDLETLAAITRRPMDEILAVVDGLIQEGVMLRMENLYRFYHDRIREAAYSLVSTAERETLHHRIGQFELQRTPIEQHVERIFFICDQLNQAGTLIHSPDEKIQLAKLNLKAGIRAKESTAYAAAVSYLVAGCELLDDTAWQIHYELTFTLFMAQMECQYLNRNFDEAERLFEIITAKAATKLDKAKAYEIMIQLYTATRTADEAIDLGIEALKIFDLRLKAKVGLGSVLIELIKARHQLKKTGVENVVQLARMKDERLHAMHRLMLYMALPAFYTNQNLFALITLMGVNASLKHGLMPHSSAAFVSFGSIVQNALGDYKLAERIGQVGLQLNKRFDNRWISGMVQHTFGFFLGHLKTHIKENLVIFSDAYKDSINAGNITYAAYSILAAAEYRLYLGHKLDDVLTDLSKHRDFIAHLKDPFFNMHYSQVVGYIQSLQGANRQGHDLSEKDADSAVLIDQFKRERNYFGLFILLIHELTKYNHRWQFEKAVQVAEDLDRISKVFNGLLISPHYYLYYSLSLIALFNEGRLNRSKHYKRILRRNLRVLRKWARMCPENFKHFYDFTAAETANLAGRFQDAMELYHSAIQAAHTNGFRRDEALAYEWMGNFYLKWNYIEEARHALRKAHQILSSWGAFAMADKLLARYPRVFNTETLPVQKKEADRPTSTEVAFRNLDLSTVMQASHIISSEILLDRLLSMTMHTAITNAGAQRGYLILKTDQDLIIQASEDMATGEKQVLQAMPLETCQGLSHGIVHYVFHSGEALILPNAMEAPDFMNDPHVLAHQCKSILCLPILNKGMLTGIFYLENNLTAEAFTAERFEILRLISTQAAISIQNARLYNDITKEIEVRKQAEEAMRGSEEKYRTILEEIQDAYCEVDLGGHITFINPIVCAISGYSSAELFGSHSCKLIQKDDREAIWLYFREIHRTGEPGKPLSCNFRSKGGRLVHLELVASLIRDKSGQATGFRILARDISERKRLERDLLASMENVQAARESTILGLAKLAEYRDEDTGSHLERIREYARILARELADRPAYADYITEAYIADIYNSSILHDIGKVGVPDAILLKPGKLTPDEFKIIQTHPALGGDALQAVEATIKGQTFLTLGKEIAYYHHEKWDGSGYPEGLKGEQIPLSARIVAVADVYDALTSKRSYKEAFSHQKAMEIIKKDRGTHFDPDVVDAFLAHEDEFRRIRETLHDSADQNTAA